MGLRSFLLAVSISASACAGARPAAPQISGWVEWASVAGLPFRVKAKLDSGAKTSSIHAENIERFKRDGERWVRFTLALPDDKDEVHRKVLELPQSRRIQIKDHDDENDRRVVVELELCFDGETRLVEFSLADRSKFIYPVLLGRRALAGRVAIDPARTFLNTGTCPVEGKK